MRKAGKGSWGKSRGGRNGGGGKIWTCICCVYRKSFCSPSQVVLFSVANRSVLRRKWFCSPSQIVLSPVANRSVPRRKSFCPPSQIVLFPVPVVANCCPSQVVLLSVANRLCRAPLLQGSCDVQGKSGPVVRSERMLQKQSCRAERTNVARMLQERSCRAERTNVAPMLQERSCRAYSESIRLKEACSPVPPIGGTGLRMPHSQPSSSTRHGAEPSFSLPQVLGRRERRVLRRSLLRPEEFSVQNGC